MQLDILFYSLWKLIMQFNSWITTVLDTLRSAVWFVEILFVPSVLVQKL
jgi:hypothetical protein